MRLALLAFLALTGCSTGAVLEDDARATEGIEIEPRRVDLEGRFVTAVDDTTLGVYGLRVHLVFRRSNGRWERLLGPERRHRHVDVLDEQGRFRFSLASSRLSRYDSLAVVPETATDAVRIVPVPRGSIQVPGLEDGRLMMDRAVRLPLSGSVERRDLEGGLPTPLGVTVRYSTLSREFVTARYGGDPPFELPQVRIEVTDSGGFMFQPFDPDVLGGTEIELNAARGITPTLVGHEYGHYVTYRMWGASPVRYALRNRNLREGWAIFFSFAMRAWAAAEYGDDHLASSNTERAPFSHLAMSHQRYEGIVYGRSKPDYAAIGSLLWNLYDGPDASPWEPSALEGDNEDVALGLDVFEAVRQTRTSVWNEAGVLEVVAALAASRPDLAASIEGARDHFLCPDFPSCDLKAPPDARPTTGSPSLRPVQPVLEVERVGGSTRLTWEPRTYTTPWANAPVAYRVLRDGLEVARLGPSSRTWTDVEGDASADYRVEALGQGD
ncbi:hypothetical protein [Rubrivirga sp.]|uniref:hypothetical protein n=1 Tax=Rubrivirga sp. TaxID=1885344 RepID=UPI003C77D042